MKKPLHGIAPAIISPCDQDDRLLEDVFESLARHMYQCGVHGLYVCGGTGDAYNLTLDERQRIAAIAMEVSRPFDGQVIVHVGTHDTRHAVALSEHAAEVGAAAVASMPPANRTFEELIDYYTDIARAAQIPTLIYHIPQLTGHNLSLEQFGQLFDIPGVVGVKFSTSDLFLLKRLLLTHPDIIIFNGGDELLVLSLLYGAHGGIGMTYNMFPRFYVRLYETVLAGDIDKAMQMQNHCAAFLDQALKCGGIRPVLTHVMNARGYGPFCFRRPRTSLTAQQAEQFDQTFGTYLRAIDDSANE